ncbi:M16 family metallopeptidase [Desulfurispira natronophila]|uniref:Putative Zn-dependent peptidase n=1 Tax=Desulfurispira natronophila TaxID=682562 RepID=A0A7W8DGM2_9BACT|nr:pitrilysin family protein [Desulfurispira natronophila]MBB5021555.1 putative Zn-dependent peptidase [Desulfurispira natronophila]
MILTILVAFGTPAWANHEVIQHPSGATVILDYQPHKEVSATELWLRAGAAFEHDEEHGMAHFLEHAVFKGTESFAVGEIEARVEGFGGRLNAATSKDFVYYFITAANSFAPQSLEILGEMVLKPTLESAEIAREKPVVEEEIRRSQDNPYGRQFEEMARQLYRGHPYGRNILGTVESVNAFAPDDLAAFHQRLYHPANLAIVVVGGFDRAEVLSKIDEMLVSRTANSFRKARALPDRMSPLYRPVSVDLYDQGVQTPSLLVGYRAVSQTHTQAPALAVLGEMLSGGVNAVLYTDFVENGILHRAFGGFSPAVAGGAFYLGASWDEEKYDSAEVRELIYHRLEALYAQLLRGDVDRLVESARNRLQGREVFSRQRVSQIASSLGRSFIADDLDNHGNKWEQLEQVQPRDVAKALRQYLLRPAYVAVTLRGPQ